ncbi:hypothetical protein HDU67_006183, partial [Dinochytrium kinnereticum]
MDPVTALIGHLSGRRAFDQRLYSKDFTHYRGIFLLFGFPAPESAQEIFDREPPFPRLALS